MADPTLASLQGELADLRAMLTDVANRNAGAQIVQDAEDEEQATSGGGLGAFWYCTYAESLTLTAGISDDWDVRFDNRAVATNRVSFFHPGPGGALNHQWSGKVCAHRYKMTFDSDSARTVSATLSGGYQWEASAGDVQIKLNGQLYEYNFNAPGGGTAHYQITLDLKAGRNEIVISKGFYPSYLALQATLFEGTMSQTVDPQTLPGFQY